MSALRKHGFSRFIPQAVLVLLVLCAALLINSDLARAGASVAEIQYYFSPNAERAVAIGDRYLDAASHSSLYDRERARYFFLQALDSDPLFPSVRHQLARIAFLDGDLPTALWYINHEIDLPHTTPSPSSYYVRGLIKGYAGDYMGAARDYEKYLESDPNNWAANNDYAWVLLKAGRFEDASLIVEKALTVWPNNPWLLNSASIALFEMGEYRKALPYAQRALAIVGTVEKDVWLMAYPGNDPVSADQGIAALQESVMHNSKNIRSKLEYTHQ